MVLVKLLTGFVELRAQVHTTEEPLCRRTNARNVFHVSKSLHWRSVKVRRGGVPAQVSSLSLDPSSKLRGRSPIALMVF
ncbi:hypothetical protein TNCV_2505031 [Trichonephila clavipes]|uniref:Uncharacterized protein n=1 Tax=Trichonephila clavipes TaxID=2585209 RepID=A0A8X7BK58_TRICX|nr:hypothetical protein TNCV_2505031 [Trichonephila clavipes]